MPELPLRLRKPFCEHGMPPKQKRCALCGTTASSSQWFTLDRSTLCFTCHDLQFHPPLEPGPERTPDGPVLGVPTQRNAAPAIANEDGGTPSDAFKKPTLPPRTLSTVRSRTRKVKGVKVKKTIQRKPSRKQPIETATVQTKSVAKVFHENFWYEVGDIVSLVDIKDNTYYAQIRGLLMDIFNEKSAVITWLLPTVASPPANEGFDPSTYHIGPDEDEPRSMNQMQFVMHAPSSYYFDRNNPFPRPDTLGPVNKRPPSGRGYEWKNIAHLHYGNK